MGLLRSGQWEEKVWGLEQRSGRGGALPKETKEWPLREKESRKHDVLEAKRKVFEEGGS